jgi:UMF1 family MFS transporter
MNWIRVFSVLYIVGAVALWWLKPDANAMLWAVGFFVLGFVAMEMATSFVSALLPGLVEDRDIGKASGDGFAFGYLGGLIALILMLLLFAENGDTGTTLIGISPIFGLDAVTREGTRFVGPFTALWYMVFMVPFFLWVKEPKRVPGTGIPPKEALVGLWVSIKGLRHRRSMAAYLGSSMFYRDALNGLYALGGVYAKGVLDWTVTQIGVFGIIAAITAGLASWTGGYADRRYGPKPVITASVVILTLVCVVLVCTSKTRLFGMPLTPGSTLPDTLFYICGALIGGAGGTIQAASRTLMVRHTTPERAAEAFGLFALSGKATAFMAPALIFAVTKLTGNQQVGFIPLILLFLVGLVLLGWVKPDGERAEWSDPSSPSP